VVKRKPISNWIETTRSRFHAGHRLVTWHPHGVLDDDLLDEIAHFTQTLEQIAEAPFDRYTDLSGLAEIHLSIGHVFDIAEERRDARSGLPLVKSALFCDKVIGFGMARMYEALMKGSAIDVRAFRDREIAAGWLGVPPEVLDYLDEPVSGTIL